MKKLILSFVAVTATIVVHAENWKPQFAKDSDTGLVYIKMAAPAGGDRCGALTVKPKGGHNILITSTLWSGFKKTEKPLSKYSGRIAQADVAGSEFVRLPAQGYRARFDWGGRSPQTHYRVYCYKRDKVNDFPAAVNCDEVVTIEDVLFNRTCGGVARMLGGTGADYGDLNMNKG
jgi:hypothetical protein